MYRKVTSGSTLNSPRYLNQYIDKITASITLDNGDLVGRDNPLSFGMSEWSGMVTGPEGRDFMREGFYAQLESYPEGFKFNKCELIPNDGMYDRLLEPWSRMIQRVSVDESRQFIPLVYRLRNLAIKDNNFLSYVKLGHALAYLLFQHQTREFDILTHFKLVPGRYVFRLYAVDAYWTAHGDLQHPDIYVKPFEMHNYGQIILNVKKLKEHVLVYQDPLTYDDIEEELER